jgi:AcrR family transcriptional regulator
MAPDWPPSSAAFTNMLVSPNICGSGMNQQPKRRRTAAETREHVLDVAHELFYWAGIRATGIDRVASEAGVAPTALYRLFPSKDALVAAYIERAEQRYQEWFDTVTKADSRTPAERIVALFKALAERTRPEICRGCPFLMALTEFPDTEVEAHQRSVRLKEWVRGRLRRLAKEHAVSCSSKVEAGLLADHLTLLFEGVYATVPALGADGPAKRARQLAASLVGLHQSRKDYD